MELHAVLRTSGAVRTWKSDPITDDVIEQILDDARFAPSGGNRQAWRVVVIRDRAQRARIGALYRDVWPEYLAQREAGLRPFSPDNDPRAKAEVSDLVRRGAGPAPGWFADSVADAPLMIAVLLEVGEVAAVDKDVGHYPIVGGASIYLFVQNILLVARNHGLGGVLTTILPRREEELLEILGAPSSMALASLILLGYPDGPFPRPKRCPVGEFATLDRLDGAALCAARGYGGGAMSRKKIDQLCGVLLEHHNPQGDLEEFLGAQFDAGLAWVHFPPGLGGLGVDAALQQVVTERLLAVGAPDPSEVNPIGYGIAAHAVEAHGDEEQKARLLRPLFTGAELWCQLFSEPSAGSDLAAVSTKAVRSGDGWIVNGQKVWTTLAHRARWGLLLARTDPSVPKHNGLTMFALDMRTSGVAVRPLYQLTGEAEFNEVFLTDVFVPHHGVVGSTDQGWRVAMTTLSAERVTLGGRSPRRGAGFIGEALELWSRRPGDELRRDRLTQLWIDAEVARLTSVRGRQALARNRPGPDGALSRLAAGTLNQNISSFCVELLGAEGLLYPEGYERTRPEHAREWGGPEHAFLRSRSNSISGGTREILRNVIAERGLNLPRDDRPGPRDR